MDSICNRLVTQHLQVGRPFEALSLLNRRRRVWESKEIQPAINLVSDAVFHDYANQYEKIRETQEAGGPRTRRMSSLVYEIGGVGKDLAVDASYVKKLFNEQRPGTRIVALGLIEGKPSPVHMDMAINAIENALSPFERYHGLFVAQVLLDRASGEQRRRLRQALLWQTSTPIHESDPSRANLKKALLESLKDEDFITSDIDYRLIEVRVRQKVIYRDDPSERHGPFVGTRRST